jgi:ketosteroid isomerase-like protein
MKGIEAYTRGDVDAVFELADDDVEFVVPDPMVAFVRVHG